MPSTARPATPGTAGPACPPACARCERAAGRGSSFATRLEHHGARRVHAAGELRLSAAGQRRERRLGRGAGGCAVAHGAHAKRLQAPVRRLAVRVPRRNLHAARVSLHARACVASERAPRGRTSPRNSWLTSSPARAVMSCACGAALRFALCRRENAASDAPARRRGGPRRRRRRRTRTCHTPPERALTAGRLRSPETRASARSGGCAQHTPPRARTCSAVNDAGAAGSQLPRRRREAPGATSPGAIAARIRATRARHRSSVCPTGRHHAHRWARGEGATAQERRLRTSRAQPAAQRDDGARSCGTARCDAARFGRRAR